MIVKALLIVIASNSYGDSYSVSPMPSMEVCQVARQAVIDEGLSTGVYGFFSVNEKRVRCVEVK